MRTSASAPPGDLARLLDTERRLEERLAAARIERDRTIAGAQAAAAQREHELVAELELDERRLAAALETERQEGERDIAPAAEREVKAYEAVPASRVAGVARDLARRFLVGGAGTVIIEMAKVRVLGPRERLPDVLRVLQDLSLLHLAPLSVVPGQPLDRARLADREERERRSLRRVLADIEAAGADVAPGEHARATVGSRAARRGHVHAPRVGRARTR